MLHRWQWHIPTRLTFGRGSIRQLGQAVRPLGRTAMLVGYRDRTATEDAYRRALQALRDEGLGVVEFFEVTPNPREDIAREGAAVAAQNGVDVVVAVGGGSVIDAAKGIAALSKTGGGLWQFTDANPDARPLDEALPLVAVPTTAGTGAEVTAVAVFTFRGVDTCGQTPWKAIVEGRAIAPAVAVVDPDLTATCLPDLRAGCGADALGHALEACMSRRANPISTTLAARAIRLILEHLPGAVECPEDPAPLTPLALAATLAGMAFTEAGLTMTHSIAHALGAILGIPHGRAVGIATPWNLRYNADQCSEVYSELATACGIAGDSADERADRFVARVVELLASIGISDRIALPPDAPADLAAALARNAVTSTPVPVKLNPRKIDEAALRALFKEIFAA